MQDHYEDQTNPMNITRKTMKKGNEMIKVFLLTVIPIVLTIISALIWDIPGAFFTMSFSALVVVLCRDSQII